MACKALFCNGRHKINIPYLINAVIYIPQILVNRLYSFKSAGDKGTLYQLKELINRTSFGKDPKHNMKATEDFLETVLFAHITAAAEELVGRENNSLISFHELCKKVVSDFVKVTVPCNDTNTPSPENEMQDAVHMYAVNFFTMGLFWYAYRDAIREGDGDRIVRYWKFLTPIFRQEHHYNYANEGFNFLAQINLLSPRQVCEIKWNRTINTTGRKGKNIPVDLHLEHLNRRLKIMMRNLGSNITPATVSRSAKTLGIIEQVCSQFSQEIGVETKDFHTIPSIEKDLSRLQQLLMDQEIFKVKPGRQHNFYPKHKPCMQSINWEKIREWVKEKIINYI